MGFASRTWFRISQRFGFGPRSGLAYWERRVRLLGPEAVVNTGNSDDSDITATVERTAISAFARRLRGDERLVVDYGCGPGRFTGALAEVSGCPVLGVDPIQALVEAAPESNGVRYEMMKNGRVPVADGAADAVFICEVLGAIVENAELHRAASEIDRILSPGGYVVLAESDSGTTTAAHWTDRPASAYAEALPFIDLAEEDAYYEGGHRIVVMSGRRSQSGSEPARGRPDSPIRSASGLKTAAPGRHRPPGPG